MIPSNEDTSECGYNVAELFMGNQLSRREVKKWLEHALVSGHGKALASYYKVSSEKVPYELIEKAIVSVYKSCENDKSSAEGSHNEGRSKTVGFVKSLITFIVDGNSASTVMDQPDKTVFWIWSSICKLNLKLNMFGIIDKRLISLEKKLYQECKKLSIILSEDEEMGIDEDEF